MQVEPLVDYAAARDWSIEPYLKYAVMQNAGMWLPITSRHRIHTVEGWLGVPPIGYRWGTRIKGGVVEARAEAVSVKRPAPQGSGYPRFPVEDWEETRDVLVVEAGTVERDWHQEGRQRNPRRTVRLAGRLGAGSTVSAGDRMSSVYTPPLPGLALPRRKAFSRY